MPQAASNNPVLRRLVRQDRFMRAVGAVALSVATSMSVGRYWRHTDAFRLLAQSPVVMTLVDSLADSDPGRHRVVLAGLSDLVIFPFTLVAAVYVFRGLAKVGQWGGVWSARRAHAARTAMFRRMAAGQRLVSTPRRKSLWGAFVAGIVEAAAFLALNSVLGSLWLQSAPFRAFLTHFPMTVLAPSLVAHPDLEHHPHLGLLAGFTLAPFTLLVVKAPALLRRARARRLRSEIRARLDRH